MTKPRPPISFCRALTRIVDLLGWDGCATVLGKSESAVRKLSDPDIEWEISLRDARRLDAAYRRSGGNGAPFLETYALQLDIAEDDTGNTPEALLAAIGDSAREYGEATSAALAVVNCSKPGTRITALREAEEAHQAMGNLIRLLGGDRVDGKGD